VGVEELLRPAVTRSPVPAFPALPAVPLPPVGVDPALPEARVEVVAGEFLGAAFRLPAFLVAGVGGSELRAPVGGALLRAAPPRVHRPASGRLSVRNGLPCHRSVPLWWYRA
jgi:hypothetical protein